MKTPYIISLGASALLVAGCATAPKTTFWEKKGDLVLVHHFDGLSDHVETLTKEKLPTNTLNPGSFPKGQYFVVDQKQFQVKKIPASRSPAKDNAADAGNLATVNKELRALRNQISAVEAENHRLQAQLGGRATVSSSDSTSLSAANAAAVREEPQLVEETPRLSQ